MKRIILAVLLLISGLIFMGCAAHSSGNFLGEAASLKYSTDERKLRFANISGIRAASDKTIHASYGHHDAADTLNALALNLNFNLLSFDYTLFNQKGGLFLSVPVALPLDIGIRPSVLQWIGPAYLGAGISFVGGYYINHQSEKRKPTARSSFGRPDGFMLWSLGGGAMFDVSDKSSFGIHATWERLALNSGGRVESAFRDHIHLFYAPLNMPPYSYRNSLTNFGVSLFVNQKYPVGLFIEWAPPGFIGNNGDYIFKAGTVIAY